MKNTHESANVITEFKFSKDKLSKYRRGNKTVSASAQAESYPSSKNFVIRISIIPLPENNRNYVYLKFYNGLEECIYASLHTKTRFASLYN